MPVSVIFSKVASFLETPHIYIYIYIIIYTLQARTNIYTHTNLNGHKNTYIFTLRLHPSGKHCYTTLYEETILKPGVHTNDFGPIYGRLNSKLGHASLATAFRSSRLTFQPIPRDNLVSPVVRSANHNDAIPDACLNTKWHHGAFIYHRR